VNYELGDFLTASYDVGKVCFSQRKSVGNTDAAVKLHPLSQELPGVDDRRPSGHGGEGVVRGRQVHHPPSHHSLVAPQRGLTQINAMQSFSKSYLMNFANFLNNQRDGTQPPLLLLFLLDNRRIRMRIRTSD
jgi:hypothetical protein